TSRCIAFDMFVLLHTRSHIESGSEGSMSQRRFLRCPPSELISAFLHTHIWRISRSSRLRRLCIDVPGKLAFEGFGLDKYAISFQKVTGALVPKPALEIHKCEAV